MSKDWLETPSPTGRPLLHEFIQSTLEGGGKFLKRLTVMY